MNHILNKLYLPFFLGDGYYHKLKFLFIILLLHFYKIVGIFKGKKCKVYLHYSDVPFYFYYSQGSDLGVLIEVFLNNEYNIDHIDPKVILDFGSNIGISVIYFKIKFPKSEIYAFEADPITFKTLKMNTQQFSGVFLKNEALAGINGMIDFYVYEGSNISSSIFERKAGQKKILIKATTLDTVFDNLPKIDLVKFDIEGAEFDVFGASKKINKVQRLIGEVHEDIAQKNVEEFIEIFKNFRVINNKRVSNKRYLVDMENKTNEKK